MRALLTITLLCLPAMLLLSPSVPAQVTGDQDGSSRQVEESDEAYRRRMELEDARRRDPTYTDPGGNYQGEQEKIDALPQASRENIRDQLVDIIVQDGEWQPSDAARDYPYEPTEEALADGQLRQQEQAAWDEQIEKYHAREAAAFGAYRGPGGDPGSPGDGPGDAGRQDGQQGGDDGASGQGGGQEGGQGSSGQAGTYQPYAAQAETGEEGVSTEGVSESALEFLAARQQGSQAGAETDPAGQEPPNPAADAATAQQAADSDPQTAEPSETDQPVDPDMRGIIAIEDLDKLRGTGTAPLVVTPPEEDEQKPDGGGQ